MSPGVRAHVVLAALAAVVVIGLAVGVLVAALDSLFDNFVVLERRTPALAAVALPVAVSGMVVYIVGRVLVG